MQIKAFQYRFPFQEPFRTGSDTYHFRKGLLLQVEHDGIRSFGEAAPLPGFSRESFKELVGYIEQNQSLPGELLTASISSGRFLQPSESDSLPASLAFALDSLTAGVLAQRDKIPPQVLIDKAAPGAIAVNATLPIGKLEQNLKRAERFWNEGYRTIKVKMGRQPDNELQLVKTLRKRYPSCAIRLDANQSWSPQLASTLLEQLAPIDIEYCEEPLYEPSAENLRKLKNTSDIPLAIDESLIHSDYPEELISNEVADFLVVKPMLIGGIQKISETIDTAKHHEYRAIITTALESGIGRMMTAVLATALGSQHHAHGLATGQYLQMDVLSEPSYIGNGEFKIPAPFSIPLDLPNCTEQLAIKQLDIL